MTKAERSKDKKLFLYHSEPEKTKRQNDKKKDRKTYRQNDINTERVNRQKKKERYMPKTE